MIKLLQHNIEIWETRRYLSYMLHFIAFFALGLKFNFSLPWQAMFAWDLDNREKSNMLRKVFLKQWKSSYRINLARADKFVPQYIWGASHSIWSICTYNHEVVVFYETSTIVIFPHNKGSCAILFRLQTRLLLFSTLKWHPVST